MSSAKEIAGVAQELGEMLSRDNSVAAVGISADDEGPFILVYLVRGSKLPRGIPPVFKGVRVVGQKSGRIYPARFA